MDHPPSANLVCSVPAGPHVEAADFAAWFPPGAAVRALLVLTPGFNGDGRGEVDDTAWRGFAAAHGLGLVGVRFRSPPQPEDRRHAYSSAALGSGQALLDAIALLAGQAGRPEAAQAPLLLWGHSAGGQFSYEFTCWRPERVVAFVANKGGYYATHLAPRAAQLVPGICFTGGRDEIWRVQSLTGIWMCNRRCGALWTLAPEPGVGHEEGGTRMLARLYFAAVLPLRLPPGASAPLALEAGGGWRGVLPGGGIRPAEAGKPVYEDVWLPDAGFAAAWSSFVVPPGSRP